MLDFKPHHVYRIAHTVDKPAIRGRSVVFLDFVDVPFAGKRARVAELNEDGSKGQIWLIWPSILIKH